MEKMLVVVFDTETKAYEGSKALQELDSDGSISVHAEAVVKKNPDGSLTTKETGGDYPIRTAEGTAIGALIGVLAGPIGLGAGALTGALAGYVADLNRAGVNVDYAEEVSGKLTPGKWAVVSDISEEWETPVDTRMTELGGNVSRVPRVSVVAERDEKEEEAMKSEIANLKSEHAVSSQKHKATIQARIDKLNTELRMKMQKAKEHSEQERMETTAKIRALEEKAKKARGDTKARIEARIATLRQKRKK